LVGLPDEPDCERIVAEARFDRLNPQAQYAELSCLVDEAYQNIGIGTYLCKRLMLLAKKGGLKGFTADVLIENAKMQKVLSKLKWNIKRKRVGATYRMIIEF